MLSPVFHQDPFNPLMKSSEVLNVSQEQRDLIRQVLDYSASDSAFCKKAAAAIDLILTKGSVPTPVITSLSPNSVAIGEPTFDIHVHGTGFTPDSKIIFGAYEEPTTVVSDTELTTGVDMSVWGGPDIIPITVSNGVVISEPMNFEFLPQVPSSDSFSKNEPKQMKLPFDAVEPAKEKTEHEKLMEKLRK